MQTDIASLSTDASVDSRAHEHEPEIIYPIFKPSTDVPTNRMSYTNTKPISVILIVVMGLPLNLNKTAAKILKVRVAYVLIQNILLLCLH